MKLIITLEFPRVEPKSSIINPYIGRILSVDKRFYYTALGFTFLPENCRHIGQDQFLFKLSFLIERLKFLILRTVMYSKSMVRD